MSISPTRRNSPPVKDLGLNIRSLNRLRIELTEEKQNLESLERTVLFPEEIYPPPGIVRRVLFGDGASNVQVNRVNYLVLYFLLYSYFMCIGV